jgi:CBS domain-containing protein
MLTEGDLLRRAELGTQVRRPRWLAWLLGPGKLASEYVHAHGRVVREIMTPDVITVEQDAPLNEVVSLMTEKGIKRIPVLNNGVVVGIVSRADILRALASSLAQSPVEMKADDRALRQAVLSQLDREAWAPVGLISVSVDKGVVTLWGTLMDDRAREAVRVAIENVPGVRAVRDHLVTIEPYTGTTIYSPDEDREETSSP